MASDPLSDRVFVLVLAGVDVARMRSTGSGEMFWEMFRLEPLAGDALPSAVLDAATWAGAELAMRHERTGIVLTNVFSAGGRPPHRARDGKSAGVEIRGTYMFVPPRHVALLARIRRWLARARRSTQRGADLGRERREKGTEP